ncbi:uncharacterized protein LOC122819043 [Drosophila biarmipes]|uniref:uncharacterized protein LOC122819043 n=1 Tax=Drosophila biarmipes TaxID=125945 RepID=UPI001CDACC2F|nr:uncharacterized protein LOC122819043 [Drosophila biarmipes]
MHKSIWTPLEAPESSPAITKPSINPSLEENEHRKRAINNLNCTYAGNTRRQHLRISTSQPGNNGGRPGSARANSALAKEEEVEEEGLQMKPKPKTKTKTETKEEGTITGRKAEQEAGRGNGSRNGMQLESDRNIIFISSISGKCKCVEVGIPHYGGGL